MKLATWRVPGRTIAVRIEGEAGIELPGVADVGQIFSSDDPHGVANADGPRHQLSDADWAPVLPRPGKIVCVGLNYRGHIQEMGRELPEHPTLFTKYPESLIGPYDPIDLPSVSNQVDWEGELVVVVGKRVRRADVAQAQQAIGGFTIMNDVTMRDYQYRTVQWFQGKTFEDSTPLGPVLVTPNEWTPGPELVTEVDGDVVQRTRTDDLVFGPAGLISYISTIFTLDPGDIIATGTPGGVGHARKPPQYLKDGSMLTTSIEGIGRLQNIAIAGR
jgi:acylpyruvate hydrolase